MSEAELHFLKMRMRGGVLSKARRGELKGPLPVGLVYGPDGQVHLDPDQQVQEILRLFFTTFRRTGAANATVKAFGNQGLLFPSRLKSGPHKGELAWNRLTQSRAIQTLKNPRYAGAFFYGRRQHRKGILPREEWISFIPGAHVGYISWDEFEENQRRLSDNARAVKGERRSPPREGPALLQGLAICGRCGLRMSVQYRTYRKKVVPDYVCYRRHVEYAEPYCQHVPGRTIDEAIGQLLVESITPLALDAVLAVDNELQQRTDEVKRLLQQRVQRAQYEADLAQRRYLQVDPDNRLVANTLEAEWNDRLRGLEEAKRYFEEEIKIRAATLTPEKRQQIRDLAVDFPRLWQDPKTPDRERKRMARLLIEDVTLIKEETYTAHVRFRGGTLHTIRLPLLPSATDAHRTPRQVVEEIDRLLDHHSEEEIATLLNERGFRSGTGKPFDRHRVIIIRWTYKLKDRFTRLREAGYLTKEEIAQRLEIRPGTVLKWRKQGLLQGISCSKKGGKEWLYTVPADDLPTKAEHKRYWLDRNLPS